MFYLKVRFYFIPDNFILFGYTCPVVLNIGERGGEDPKYPC
jgi:hypothetical protein